MMSSNIWVIKFFEATSGKKKGINVIDSLLALDLTSASSLRAWKGCANGGKKSGRSIQDEDTVSLSPAVFSSR